MPDEQQRQCKELNQLNGIKFTAAEENKKSDNVDYDILYYNIDILC